MEKEPQPRKVHPTELILLIGNRCHKQPPPSGKAYRSIQNSPCLIFNGDETRYGEIMFNHRRLRVHRVVYEDSVNESLTDDEQVRHICDIKGCANSAHLESGTAKDNFNDTQKRKRNPAYGARNGTSLYPERVPRGIRKYGKPVTPETAADIKQCLSTIESPERDDFISIAAHFATSPDQVEAICHGDDFVEVKPSGNEIEVVPLSRESLTVPYPNFRRKDLTEAQVADIRWEYFIARNSDRRELKKDLRKRYGISRATLQHILGRKTFKHVAPEIPVLNEQGSGVAILTDHEVQCIRSTWEAHPEHQSRGLAAALHRIFPVSDQSIRRIIDRDQRKSVPDDPDKALKLEEIPLLPLHKKGEDHPARKLSAAQVREIRRIKAGKKVTNRELAKKFGVSAALIGMIINRKIWKEID